MPPIYVATIITAGLTAAVFIPLFQVMAGPHRRLLWLAVLTLPLSFVINDWVKAPLLRAVGETAGSTGSLAGAPLGLAIFVLFTAPVTEEAVKALPLVVGKLRAACRDPGAALWAGMFLGTGFGFSEIGYLARAIARSPAFAGYPFWAFTGFLGERLVVTYAHAVLTAVVVTGWARGRPWSGYLAAVGLHALLNLGAMLAHMGRLPAPAAQAWIVLPVIILTGLLVRMYRTALAAAPRPQAVFFRRPPA